MLIQAEALRVNSTQWPLSPGRGIHSLGPGLPGQGHRAAVTASPLAAAVATTWAGWGESKSLASPKTARPGTWPGPRTAPAAPSLSLRGSDAPGQPAGPAARDPRAPPTVSDTADRQRIMIHAAGPGRPRRREPRLRLPVIDAEAT
jgi:hypothetical protein